MKFLIYDLESTGLSVVTSEILEISILDYDSEEVIYHKYVFPYRQKIENSDIHGIDLDVIKKNNGISQFDLVNELNELFQNMDDTVLMIAHNNNGYDQLLLEYTFKKVDDKIYHKVYFSDSLPVLRNVMPKLDSYKLGDIYRSIYTDNSLNFHNAKDDTIALLKVLKSCNNTLVKKKLLETKRPAFSNPDIKKMSLHILYGLEYCKAHRSLKTIYDLSDVFIILERQAIIRMLRDDFHVYSKYKVNKIIEQLALVIQ